MVAAEGRNKRTRRGWKEPTRGVRKRETHEAKGVWGGGLLWERM